MLFLAKSLCLTITTARLNRKLRNCQLVFSYSKLGGIAIADGKKRSSNNTFDIDNTFFDTRLKAQLKRLKQSQTKFNYLNSPEYNDLQLVLSQFAQDNTNVLFVIPPVNRKWANYTGLNQAMYQKQSLR